MIDPIASALAGEPTAGLWAVTLGDSAAMLAEQAGTGRSVAREAIAAAIRGDVEPLAELAPIPETLATFKTRPGRAAAIAEHIGMLTGRWR